MKEASDAELTAAGAIGDQLLSEFGPNVKRDRVKQFTGRLIKQALADENYEHLGRGYQAQPNPVFVRASRYQRRGGATQERAR